ncbi:unnamed protein product, partial [marine sediment metagenome]
DLTTTGAITAASYGGITEANLLDKSAAETIEAIWGFNGGVTKFMRSIDEAAVSPSQFFQRKRDGDPTDDVSSGDVLGNHKFYGYHTDGYDRAADIRVIVDGTPGDGDMPGRLEFLTTPDGTGLPLLRMTIKEDGTTRVDADLHTEGNLYINKDSTDADAVIYFGDNDEVASVHLDDANDRFEFSKKVHTPDTLTMSFVIVEPTAANDFPFTMLPKAITIIAASGVCIAGTNVVGVLMEYDNDAANAVVCNSSDWTFTTGEERTTSVSNASIDAG